MWFMAIKHLFSRKSQTFLTFLAILLGAGGYVVFSGMQLGFQEFMIDRLIERSGHITITTRNEFITAENIKGYFFPGAYIRWMNAPSGRRSYRAKNGPPLTSRNARPTIRSSRPLPSGVGP